MSIDTQDLSEVKHEVVEVVRKAGSLLLPYLDREINSHSKGGLDFATEADDALDKFLRDSLKTKFPDSHFLTEETAPEDYTTFRTAENLWVIDPIDGTTNFSRGVEPFCISVGLVSRGKPILGVIYEPTKNALYQASRDDDFAIFNENQKLKVSKISSLGEALIVSGFPWGEDQRVKLYAKLGKIYKNVRAISMRGSAAQDLCEVASGRIDAMFTIGIKPWDIAAGSLFVAKAGGLITRLDGGDWNVFDQELIFSNRLLHKELLSVLN